MEGLTERILKDAIIEIEPEARGGEHLGYRYVEIRHPDYFDQPYAGFFGGAKPPDKAAVVADVVRDYVFALIGDIDLSRNWRAPLGSSMRFHERLLGDRRHDLTEPDIALHLDLPILKGVDLETLIKVREAEGASFEAFRNSLRLAIRERLRTASSIDAGAIALEIESDVIAPALADIERKLVAARKVLVKKAVTGVGIGAATTTCGLLTGNPLLVTTGVGAAMTSLAAANKYFEEQRDIALSDMYFVWRARGN